MEIRIYDRELKFRGIVEQFTSLLWHRFYNSTGDFELKCPIIPENVRLLTLGSIVYVRGKDEAGVIESVNYNANGQGLTMTIKGRFLDCYMTRRLIPTMNFEGLAEVGMRDAFEACTEIPLVELGELQGFTEEVTFQVTYYENLLKYEQNIAQGAAFGYRFRPDIDAKKIFFEIYKGQDHTINQTERPRVVFSDEYDNMITADLTENDQLYYNICIVGGQGEADYKTFVTVGDDESTGLDRRELYYEATDVLSNGLTWEQYLEALKQRGQVELDNHPLARSFECKVIPDSNFIYRKDYDVGDIVTVQKTAWGVSEDLRLTEVSEAYEHELPTVTLTFGTPLPSVINWGG